MRQRRKTTIIVAGGALAIASVGYGLGTQADDGTAIADSAQTRAGTPRLPFERGGPPGFGELAKKLGVGTTELRQALGAFHDTREKDHRAEFATALATALGIDSSRVDDALKALAPERTILPGGPIGTPRQDRRHLHRAHPAVAIRQLATRLGVTRAELRKALREVRPDGPRAGWKQHQAELARFLAERFDLDAEKTAAALEAARPPLSPHGPGGPPDHPRAL
ncbi:MAG: hypothetical protein QOE69_3366 [Thermoleophilaceae bacterium]|jgi:hypothetical protein|nr:hypothetical protein [Thermoleophilaceae bacterium]